MYFHVVVNPAGASGKTGKIWKKLEPVFRNSGKDYEVHYSSRDCGIEEICRRLEKSCQEELCIVTVGGDGSVNEAVNGLEHPGRVLFAHIPAGSGNDLVRDMKLSGKPEQLAKRILEGRVRRTCDIGEICYADTGETRRFAVSCGVGFDAGVCEMAGRSRYKGALNRLGLGKLIYLVSAFRVVRGQRSGSAEIILEQEGKQEKLHYSHLFLMAGMNHQFEGGGFRFAPAADPDDGRINLCIADPEHNRAFYRIFPYVLFGRHERFSCIHAFAGTQADIRTSEPVWVHTDGEVNRKSDHVSVRMLKEKLRFLE